MLKEGLIYKATTKVQAGNTAKDYGSGSLEVFATPAMVALMENASLKCVEEHLDDGFTTVGTRLEISHVKGTPFGKEVWAIASLIKIEGRKLTFRVEAFDNDGLIGEGTHERFIVDILKFISKLN